MPALKDMLLIAIFSIAASGCRENYDRDARVDREAARTFSFYGLEIVKVTAETKNPESTTYVREYLLEDEKTNRRYTATYIISLESNKARVENMAEAGKKPPAENQIPPSDTSFSSR